MGGRRQGLGVVGAEEKKETGRRERGKKMARGKGRGRKKKGRVRG